MINKISMKVSVWQDINLDKEIPLEQAIAIIERDPLGNEFFCLEDNQAKLETLDNTEEYITVCDNDFNATVELYYDKEKLWSNELINVGSKEELLKCYEDQYKKIALVSDEIKALNREEFIQNHGFDIGDIVLGNKQVNICSGRGIVERFTYGIKSLEIVFISISPIDDNNEKITTIDPWRIFPHEFSNWKKEEKE